MPDESGDYKTGLDCVRYHTNVLCSCPIYGARLNLDTGSDTEPTKECLMNQAFYKTDLDCVRYHTNVLCSCPIYGARSDLDTGSDTEPTKESLMNQAFYK